MPARNAPSASDRPASSVSAASPSVISSTFSMNSSELRCRATRWNQARIGFCPAKRMSPSATTALTLAVPSAIARSPPLFDSDGSTIRNATTARSWNSRMPITSRPCGVASSIRSASIFETIAVELIASAPPSARPAGQPWPKASSASIAPIVVIATCASPSPNTARRIDFSCGRLNSRPIENIRNTMPNSARCRVSLVAGTHASAFGPTTMPTSR